MSDLIRIVDLEVWLFIGVPDAERTDVQRLLICAELAVNDFTAAAAGDDVALTVNYYEVTELIKSVCRARPRKLLETLITELAEAVLGKFPVKTIRLEVKKFIIPEARYVSVEIERHAIRAA